MVSTLITMLHIRVSGLIPSITKFVPFYQLLPVSPILQRLATPFLLFVSRSLMVFSIPHISKIIQYMSFSIWLISFRIMPSRLSTHVVTNDRISLIIFTVHCICVCVCVHYKMEYMYAYTYPHVKRTIIHIYIYIYHTY